MPYFVSNLSGGRWETLAQSNATGVVANKNIFDYDEIMLILYSTTSYEQIYGTEIIPCIPSITKSAMFLTTTYGECGIINVTSSSFKMHISNGKAMVVLGRKYQ